MHKGSEIREAFQEWLDGNDDDEAEGRPEGEPEGQPEGQPEADPDDIPRKFIGTLWNCTDVLPAGYCDLLDIPKGSTYAQAVQGLAAEKAARQRPGQPPEPPRP